MTLYVKVEGKAIDEDFRQYDSISVSPEQYDPIIPLLVCGDPIVSSLSSPISEALANEHLSESVHSE